MLASAQAANPSGLFFLLEFTVYSASHGHVCNSARHPEGHIQTMSYAETIMGRNVRFLLPSLKLKQRSRTGGTLEDKVHRHLVQNFGGYTATTANLFGFWKDRSGRDSYGEHREFVVAVSQEKLLPKLKQFLATVCAEMNEECLYLEVAGQAMLLYGEEPGAHQRKKRSTTSAK